MFEMDRGGRNRKWVALGIISAAFLAGSILQDALAEAALPYKDEIIKKIHVRQIPFTENKGQIRDEGVKYYATALGGTIYVMEDGVLVYAFQKYGEDGTASHKIGETQPHLLT